MPTRLRSLAFVVAIGASACAGSTEPSKPTLTGAWRSYTTSSLWDMTLYESPRGVVSGTASLDAPDICGCDASYAVEGMHDATGVELALLGSGFAGGPTFTGQLVHRDTLRGGFEGTGSGTNFIRQ